MIKYTYMYYAGSLIGYPPTIIVSDAVVKAFIPDAYVYKATVRYREEYSKAEEEILGLLQADPGQKGI